MIYIARTIQRLCSDNVTYKLPDSSPDVWLPMNPVWRVALPDPYDELLRFIRGELS